jgi:hypothetical protein
LKTISKRHLFGLSIAAALLVLIVAVNIFLRVYTPASATDYEVAAQYIQSVGKIMIIVVSCILGICLVGGTVAFTAGRKTIAMKLYTGFLFAAIVAVSATWSFTPRAYLILPLVFFTGTILFEYLKMYGVRREFFFMLMISVVTAAAMRIFMLLS